MINTQPIILHDADSEAGWDDEVHGCVQWRTLFSADSTSTEAITAGIAEIMPGDQLKVHHHAQAEIYYILNGSGDATIDGKKHFVNVGTAIFIPGNAAHGIQNTGRTTLRFLYAFAVDSFSEVEYVF